MSWISQQKIIILTLRFSVYIVTKKVVGSYIQIFNFLTKPITEVVDKQLI